MPLGVMGCGMAEGCTNTGEGRVGPESRGFGVGRARGWSDNSFTSPENPIGSLLSCERMLSSSELLALLID